MDVGEKRGNIYCYYTCCFRYPYNHWACTKLIYLALDINKAVYL